MAVGMDRVLVTGGCGFIGHHVVRGLLATGSRVVVLDDLSTGSLHNLPEHPRVHFHQGSVLNRATVAGAAYGVDLVVHLAGVVGMRLAHANPDVAYAVSVLGARNVLAATDAPFVFVSSSAVYGLDGADETDECLPLTCSPPLSYDAGQRGYAMGKWMAERLVLRATRGGRPVMVLRPFNVVGRGQKSGYGMVLPRFIANAMDGRALTIYGDGLQTRCFGDVETFVATLVRLLRTPAAWHAPTNVINVGNPVATSIRTLANLVLHTSGQDVPIQFIPYEHVFDGKRDVQHRFPRVERLAALIGRPGWRDLAPLVGELCAEARAARREPAGAHRAGRRVRQRARQVDAPRAWSS